MARLLRMIAAAATLVSTSAMATEGCVRDYPLDMRAGCEALVQVGPPAYDYETACRQTYANHANPCILQGRIAFQSIQRSWDALTPAERSEVLDVVERRWDDAALRVFLLESQVRSKVMQHFYNDAGK